MTKPADNIVRQSIIDIPGKTGSDDRQESKPECCEPGDSEGVSVGLRQRSNSNLDDSSVDAWNLKECRRFASSSSCEEKLYRGWWKAGVEEGGNDTRCNIVFRFVQENGTVDRSWRSEC